MYLYIFNNLPSIRTILLELSSDEWKHFLLFTKCDFMVKEIFKWIYPVIRTWNAYPSERIHDWANILTRLYLVF